MIPLINESLLNSCFYENIFDVLQHTVSTVLPIKNIPEFFSFFFMTSSGEFVKSLNLIIKSIITHSRQERTSYKSLLTPGMAARFKAICSNANNIRL